MSLATAVLVTAFVQQGSALGAVFGCEPMRWVGERSYGIYLWQTPVIVFSQGLPGRHGWQLDMLNIVVTLALAALSWTPVEDPIRRPDFRAHSPGVTAHTESRHHVPCRKRRHRSSPCLPQPSPMATRRSELPDTVN